MKQYEAVIETLDKLGGVANLGELNIEVFKISDCEWKTKTPFASIRRIVQQTKVSMTASYCFITTLFYQQCNVLNSITNQSNNFQIKNIAPLRFLQFPVFLACCAQ